MPPGLDRVKGMESRKDIPDEYKNSQTYRERISIIGHLDVPEPAIEAVC